MGKLNGRALPRIPGMTKTKKSFGDRRSPAEEGGQLPAKREKASTTKGGKKRGARRSASGNQKSGPGGGSASAPEKTLDAVGV